MNVGWTVALIVFLNTLGAGVWAIVAYTLYNRTDEDLENVYERDCEVPTENRDPEYTLDLNNLYNGIEELEEEVIAVQSQATDCDVALPNH